MRAKIKLHGTHARIEVNSELQRLLPGKRSTPFGKHSGTHYGFDNWVNTLSYDLFPKKDIVIYGEWCGSKIQKGVACSRTPNRTFYVFGVAFFDKNCVNPYFVWDVDSIKSYLPNSLDSDMRVIPWFDDNSYTIDNLTSLEKKVELIDKEDPLMLAWFGIKGHGEGLVLMNSNIFELDHNSLIRNALKVKGISHKKSNPRIKFDKENPQLDNFLIALDEIEFESALERANTEKHNMMKIGVFLKEVLTDFEIENKHLMEDCDLQLRKHVFRKLTQTAKTWYLS